LIVRSTYRSPEHGRTESGAPASKHMDGTALDIAMGNHDPDVYETAARGGPEAPPSACPPVVEYNSAEQARLAGEVTALHLDTLTVDWLADYPVLREQARECR